MSPRAGIDWEEVHRRLHASQQALERALGDDPARVEAAFRHRAEQLASRRARETDRTAGLRVLVFALGADRYGIELSDLVEVVPFARCTSVPGGPRQLLGVINFRGAVRSVVDLGR